ncbi:MAG: tryptophan synthase subunit alpha [Synergistaceae bacterium]|jgi:tryptophan synthase alpha chain|nr:tryptophan synthase subunit alpha [Synergistaceae bacterium]
MTTGETKNPGRYERLFANLRERNEKAFIPFVMLGDPDAAQCEAIIETLTDSGADALELGIPFSDPVADGPVIQAASNRALGAGITPDRCFEIISRVRGKHADIPMGLLTYANVVVGRGAESFYRKAADSGVDSVLVADVPAVEAGYFVRCASASGIDPVFVVPPNASDDKLREIAGLTKGYAYFLGRAGVTGADREMSAPPSRRVEFLSRAGSPPVIVGFGISKPEHVKAAVLSGASGAISGSAVVEIIARNLGDTKKTLDELAKFTSLMKSATKENA